MKLYDCIAEVLFFRHIVDKRLNNFVEVQCEFCVPINFVTEIFHLHRVVMETLAKWDDSV